MKSYNQWYPRYVGTYMKHTQHLSILEHGAYTLLMDFYYSTGKPLPANAVQLHRICRAFDDAEKLAVDRVVDEFFVLTDDGYTNQRIDKELLKRGNISESRSSAAKKRHANAEQMQSKCNQDASVLHDTTTTTTTKEEYKHPTEYNSAGEGSGGFNSFGFYGGVDSVISQLGDDGLQKAKIAAPGWDVYHLAEIYLAGMKTRGAPKSIKKAFPAWCANYTKGNPP